MLDDFNKAPISGPWKFQKIAEETRPNQLFSRTFISVESLKLNERDHILGNIHSIALLQTHQQIHQFQQRDHSTTTDLEPSYPKQLAPTSTLSRYIDRMLSKGFA